MWSIIQGVYIYTRSNDYWANKQAAMDTTASVTPGTSKRLLAVEVVKVFGEDKKTV